MKSSYYLLFIYLNLSLCSCISYAYVTGIEETASNLDTTHVTRDVTRFYYDAISYTSGGITVTYPASFFSGVPFITVTLELSGIVYNLLQILVPQVTSNTASSTTIRVNFFNLLGVLGAPLAGEVATGGVIVHFRAVGV